MPGTQTNFIRRNGKIEVNHIQLYLTFSLLNITIPKIFAYNNKLQQQNY